MNHCPPIAVTARRPPIAPLPTPPQAAAPAPGRLLVMVCEAALRFLESAGAARAGGQEPCAAANIRSAQCILVELMGALDPPHATELTETLAAFYQSVFDFLTEAGHGNDACLAQARHDLALLRDAWEGAFLRPSPAQRRFAPPSIHEVLA